MRQDGGTRAVVRAWRWRGKWWEEEGDRMGSVVVKEEGTWWDQAW